ncbi:MAG: hypothetical protein ACO1SV_07505 [Fimbriimonas sp.]
MPPRFPFPHPLAGLLLAACLLPGCGGGGSKDVVDPNDPAITLTADHYLVEPGEPVTLAWSSRNADEVTTSNLGVVDVNGTLTVIPTFTSDYTLTVAGSGTDTATVRVTVDRPRPRFAVVGNAADPEIPQIQALLQQAGTVTVTPSLPAASTYDAVVIHGSGSVGPSDASAVQATLSSNKGVVLVGFAPTKLATGNASFTDDGGASDEALDTSPIASWFGGVTEVVRGATTFTSPWQTGVNLGYFALPTAVDPAGVTYDSGDGDDPRLPAIESGRVGAAAYRTIATNYRAIGFAFRPPTGGRVAWQWHSGGFDPGSQARVSALFRTACMWAACP